MAASSCKLESEQRTPASVLAQLSARSQAEADTDPTCSRKYEIEAEEEPQNVEARYRPMCENHEAEKNGDRAGQRHPDPRRSLLHAKRQDNPHDSRSDKRESKQKRQQCRREKRIFERDEARDDVEDAKQDP
jgi:hypothetical protein